MRTNVPDSRTTLIGLCGDGDQQAVADMLLAQGHTVLMHIRWPREVFELRKAGGELWQVGEGTVTMSHDDDVWPVEPDRHVRP